MAANAHVDSLGAAGVSDELYGDIESATVLQHALLNNVLGGDLHAEQAAALRVQTPSLGYYVAARIQSRNAPMQVTGVWFIPASSTGVDEIWPVNGPAMQLSTGEGQLDHTRGKRNEQAIQALTAHLKRQEE